MRKFLVVLGVLLIGTICFGDPSISYGGMGIGRATADGRYVLTTGGTMTGNLIFDGSFLVRVMINNSGQTLGAGSVVILDTSDSTGQSVTTAESFADPKIFGMLLAETADAADGDVLVNGVTSIMKVSGPIALDDPLTTSSEAGWACKGSYNVGAIVAIALATSESKTYEAIPAWVQ